MKNLITKKWSLSMVTFLLLLNSMTIYYFSSIKEI